MREYEVNGGERGRMRAYEDEDRGEWRRGGERGREDRGAREQWRGGERHRHDDEEEKMWRRHGVRAYGQRHRENEDEYEAPMLGNSVASVWEITSQSRHSFDDAIRYGIHRARQSLRHIKGVWVQGQEVMLRSNEIYAFRVQLKVTFVLEDR